MKNKVKAWIESEYEYAKTRGNDSYARHAIDRCYGIIMFAINELFDDYNDELGKWWDDEMLPKFRELEERG